MECFMCGGTGLIRIRLPGGEELETYCLECLDREAEDFEEGEEDFFVPWDVLWMVLEA